VIPSAPARKATIAMSVTGTAATTSMYNTSFHVTPRHAGRFRIDFKDIDPNRDAAPSICCPCEAVRNWPRANATLPPMQVRCLEQGRDSGDSPEFFAEVDGARFGAPVDYGLAAPMDSADSRSASARFTTGTSTTWPSSDVEPRP